MRVGDDMIELAPGSATHMLGFDSTPVMFGFGSAVVRMQRVTDCPGASVSVRDGMLSQCDTVGDVGMAAAVQASGLAASQLVTLTASSSSSEAPAANVTSVVRSPATEPVLPIVM